MTAPEVLQYAPVSREYPTKDLEKFIFPIEQRLRVECIGEDFYDWLETDKVDYSTTATAWENGVCYDINDVVLLNGTYWQSTQANNKTKPGYGNPSQWNIAPKFQSTCANIYWTNYLAPIISLQVLSRSLVFSTHQTTPGGLTIHSSDEGRRNATTKEFSTYRDEISKQINDLFFALNVWLYDNVGKSTCDLPASAGYYCSRCTETHRGGAGRRWNFK